MADLGKVVCVPKGDWVSGTTYGNVDIVQHSGCSWISTSDNNLEEPSGSATKWELLAKNGNQWYSGTAISGKSATPTIFSGSGITYAQTDDSYLNTTEGAVYNCVTPGAASVATWAYQFTLDGASTWGDITGKPFDAIGSTLEVTDISGTDTLNAKADPNKVSYTDNTFLGSKNLNSFPYYEVSKTSNGITYTVNTDGTIAINGTATADSVFDIHYRTKPSLNNLIIPNGKYILTGCPSGGGASTYFIEVRITGTSGVNQTIGYDTGNGFEFTLNGDYYSSDEVNLGLRISIPNGSAISDLLFKPMIRLASDPDSTYRPYGATNVDLTKDALSVVPMLNVLGAKNLYPNTFKTQTVNGVTFTVNADKSITMNGTAAADIEIAATDFTLKAGQYILNGAPDTGFEHDTIGYFRLNKSGFGEVRISSDNPSIMFSASTDYSLHSSIKIRSGAVLDNVTIKPMIRDARIADDTYVPYVMTNKELMNKFSAGPTNLITFTRSDQYAVNEAVNTRYKIIGDICIVSLVVQAVSPTASNSYVVFTLPAPAYGFSFGSLKKLGSNDLINVGIDGNGGLYFAGGTANDVYYGSLVYDIA